MKPKTSKMASIPTLLSTAIALVGAAALAFVAASDISASEPPPIPPELPGPMHEPQAATPSTERPIDSSPSERGVPPSHDADYTYRDGERTIRLVLEGDLVVQKTSALTPDDYVVVKGARNSIVRKQAGQVHDASPVFRSESGGGLMTLPGGVLLALDPEWDQAHVEGFFSRNGISTDWTSEVDFVPNGFLVQTDPGFPSLELANVLAGQDGVLISSPNWWREVEAKEADDHGDFPGASTPLPLGFSVAGHIDPGDDRDVFRLDLSGASKPTDVWMYTTGPLNTVGELTDSSGETLASNNDLTPGRERNFHLRAILPNGVYYVTVSSFWEIAGEYRLYASVATDAGNSMDTATPLSLASPTTGTIGAVGDADYFRLDLTESVNLILTAESGNSEAIDGVVLDADGTELSVNVFPLPELVHPTADRTGFLVEDDLGPGSYYIKVTTPDSVTSYPVPYTVHATEDTEYPKFVEDCEANTRSLNDPQINDPLYACQWHLNSREDVDINVEPVWAEGIKGEGINVAVVDDGMHYTHEDLRDNVDASLNHDYTGNGDIHHPLEHHGTNVAGVIAARDNSIGVRGVAPRATIYGYNYLTGESTDRNGADAMARNRDVTAVSNNSWGPTGGPGLGLASSFWELAIDAGTRNGYNGKGVFYAFGGGNAYEEGDNSNLNELANYHGVTAVCAVDDNDARSYYSEMGANLWVCAPSSGGSENRRTVTIENNHRYSDDFGGTSAATPVVSGVVALLRDANPDLTWRDLKLILAASARKNDAGNPGWEDGARKYGSDSATDRYHFNHEYGFGVVDAKAAVDLAKGWTKVGLLQSPTGQSSMLNTSIPDAPVAGTPTSVRSSLTLDTAVEFIEFVEVEVSLGHDSFRDLEIELESPSGAISQLIGHFDTVTDDDPNIDFVPLNGSFRFGSARHLGENPSGEWNLHVTDRLSLVEGSLDSWSVTVYGHGPILGPPSVDSVTPGDGSLTVAWTAPSQTEGLTVDSYDLRYVQTAVDEAEESNWTVVEDVWDAATGGDLEYTVPALVGGAQYDVQVRAESGSSSGPWSTTVRGTPSRIETNACATGRAVSDAANNPGLVADCNALLAARDALAGSATLSWSANDPISDWDGVAVDGTSRRITGLNLFNRRLTGALPTEIGSLTELRRLILAQNDLTGPIPAWLGDLSSLQVLSLWGNRLAGTMPAELGNLSNLQYLLLSGEQMTGTVPAELGDLSNLQWLYLYDSQLNGPVPEWLGSMTTLQRIFLYGNKLTGEIPEELGNLTNLVELSLSDNELTGPIPSELANLTNLQQFSLWGNQLTGTVPVWLGDLANLKRLSLAQNRLSGPIPSELGRLANLQQLHLSNNQFTGTIPGWLGDLTNLQRLSLSWNQLTGQIPTELDDLANLESLNLRGNQLTGCISEGLRDVASNDLDEVGLPFCDVLLSDLTMKPGSLVPPFDAYVTDYTAVVGQSQITIVATNDHNASLQILDQGRNEIVDADGSQTGHQVDLDAGVTTIRIRVISEDGRATNSYTVRINRANPPGPPTISVISPGREALSVFWTPPIDFGGADIESYDLRYIESAASDKSDAEWIERADVWSSGQLRYTVTGLMGGTAHDVQVRAVHGAGSGPWSETVTGTPKTQSDCVTGGAVTDAANAGLISDCEALLAGRDTLAKAVSLNWSTDTPMSEWYGITVRGTPSRVVWLNIRGGGLRGSVPAELGRLSSLTYLNLRNNELTGRIPDELGNLTKLRYLGLNNNGLTGPIPDLSAMTNLEQLYLSNNDLSGRLPSWMGTLTKVRELWLWGNELEGPIPNLSGMTGLDRLKLQNNRFTDGIPAWFGEMTNLRYLYLHFNPLGGEIPSALGDMEGLRYLWLHNGQLTGGIPAALGRLTNLWDLNLHTNQLSDPIPAELGGMDSLQRLRLHRNILSGVIPETLGNLDSLRFMWLHGNMLSGEIPSELGVLPRLQRLYLSENRLTGDIPTELDDLADTLTHWRLAENQFTGCVPAELAAVADTDLDSLGLQVCTDS